MSPWYHTYKWISITPVSGTVEFPLPPGENASYSQRMEWAGLVAAAGHLGQRGTTLPLSFHRNYLELVWGYCERWKVTQAQAFGAHAQGT